MNRGLQFTMRVRKTAPAQFFDVQFRDTVKAPLDVVRRIYDFIDWPMTADADTAMRLWLAQDDEAHAKVAHDYAPEQFGLSADQLRHDFSAYRERHIHAA